MNLARITIFVSLLLVEFCFANNGNLDISAFGGKPNSDIAKALSSAWTQACASTTPVKIVIPGSTYQMSVLELKGPCKAPIEIQIDGTIKAPADPNTMKGAYHWLTIGRVDSITLSGKGVFDGQGANAWKRNDCHKNYKCKGDSMNLGFNFVNNSIVRGLTSKDSKTFHVNVISCNNFTFDGFKVSAPNNSPNTDGIHIGRSTNVNVINTDIATGDDCISIGDGNKKLTIQNVVCGPGHGISIGSLGRYEIEESVEGLLVKNCTFKGTDNGVRIKTWPNSPVKITVSDMHFEDLIMTNVRNPIIIDQEYCPWNQCKKQNPSKIKISNISFKNIKGTSSALEGVVLSCSSGVPCQDIEMANVDLTFNGAAAKAKCSNVKPKIIGKAPACGDGVSAGGS
ncbi:hypothetical protein VNO78_02724 [Psophocarpus tetragonolobus]|uniref:Polygalacturonase n=1 Tax=Psophocarpus tetragonolobus TaxID=3891 RepID=A0AAN9SZC5_PSOTE